MDFIVVIVIIIAWALGLGILYAVIQAAVRNALSDHYKTVRWFEKTGQWVPGSHGTGAPRAFEDSAPPQG